MTRLPLVGIGLLIDIDWLPIGHHVVSRTKMPARKWIAWRGDARTGDLVIGDRVGRSRTQVKEDERHETFHDAPVGETIDIEWSTPDGRLKPVGKLYAVRYRIPPGMDSNKSGSDWRHDFGEKDYGVMRHDDKYKPWISRDGKGGLYVVRRTGNDYELSDWLRG